MPSMRAWVPADQAGMSPLYGSGIALAGTFRRGDSDCVRPSTFAQPSLSYPLKRIGPKSDESNVREVVSLMRFEKPCCLPRC